MPRCMAATLAPAARACAGIGMGLARRGAAGCGRPAWECGIAPSPAAGRGPPPVRGSGAGRRRPRPARAPAPDAPRADRRVRPIRGGCGPRSPAPPRGTEGHAAGRRAGRQGRHSQPCGPRCQQARPCARRPRACGGRNSCGAMHNGINTAGGSRRHVGAGGKARGQAERAAGRGVLAVRARV